MGNVQPQVAAGSDVKLVSGAQIVSEMLKQEGANNVSRWHETAVN